MVYRPNEAKVKNLKAKDYLGKARLVAAFDRGSTAQGFGGFPDIKRTTPPAIEQRAFEDRSAESISYGAMNLAHRNLNGRSRQHSEPPLNRNLFPPTPPPDTDKVSTNSSSTGSLGGGRSASVRAARPPRLDLDRPGANIIGRSTDTGDKSRIGTTRTASESRGQSSQQPRGLYIQNAGQHPGYWDPTGHRRGVSDTGFAPTMDNRYTDIPYGFQPPARRSLVMSNGGSRKLLAPRHQPQQYIDEEEEYASDACDEEEPDTFNNDDFEILDASTSRHRKRSSATGGSRRGPPRRPPEIHKFRIKVHALEDKRYIIVGPAVGLAEFERKIRDKFGFRSPLKIRMRDNGDMVSMVDQEDLDLLLMAAREYARRERSELGKMEVWVEELSMI